MDLHVLRSWKAGGRFSVSVSVVEGGGADGRVGCTSLILRCAVEEEGEGEEEEEEEEGRLKTARRSLLLVDDGFGSLVVVSE